MKRVMYYILILAALGLVAYLFSTIKTPYDWSTTLSRDSREPFGMALFDELMTESLPGGYEVQNDYTETMNPDSVAILYLKYNASFWANDSIETDRAIKLQAFAIQGGTVIYATTSASETVVKDNIFCMRRTRKSDTHFNYGILPSFINDYKEKKLPKDLVTCVSTSKDYKVNQFLILNHNLSAQYDKRRHTPILYYEKWDHMLAYSMKYPSGGEVEIVSSPLFFTNYAVLDDSASQVTKELLKVVGNRHLVRIIGENINKKTSGKGDNHSIFSYILSQPSLRWALNILMITLVIFAFFNMRRKMRPIPLLTKQTNATLEFAKFMGTFHFHRANHGSLVVLRYDELLKLLDDTFGWETSKMGNVDLSRAIASKTGESDEKVLQLIRTVTHLRHNHRIDQKTMMQLIDYILELKQKL